MNRSGRALPHLLIGVDFSGHSRHALEQARRIAGQLGIALYLVHVIESADGEEDPIDARALQWLSEARISLALLWIRYGRPHVELARTAAQSNATALVIGSHGESGFQPLALGSTASRLGLVAPCPVIIVNSRSTDRQTGGTVHGQRAQASPPPLEKDHNSHAWLSED